MGNDITPDNDTAVSLRAEAFPVEQQEQLTSHQQAGLLRLLRMLHAAVDRLNSRQSEVPLVPTWLTHERRAQLAFVDGHRGAGKTTLMTTLVRLIVPQRGSHYFEQFSPNAPRHKRKSQKPNLNSIPELVESLRDRVVVLEPLDMEPLPKSTPILAAILARLSGAARDCDADGERSRGLLDPALDDDRDFIRFQQFQSQIARALDGNLADRRGSLDREQYGRAVMEQEDDRLRIRSSLDIVLRHLSRAIEAEGSRIPPRSNEAPKHLFLVPVDDVDLNPTRCLELLRLLRSYSPPQLFFLLMGQFDLVETIVKLSMASEYAKIRGGKTALQATTEHKLDRDLAEVAAANLQKMVPDVIELPALAINEILSFRPLGTPQDAVSLGDLFERVTFQNADAFPTGVDNLRKLLTFQHRADDKPRTSPDYRIGEYPGLGAFQVSPRRLVDLWRHLSEALEREANGTQIDDNGPDPVMQVLEHHWHRVVDEDPHLDAESRARLQNEGISACEVILNSDHVSARLLPVGDASVELRETDEVDAASFQPLLALAGAGLESGIPRLRVSQLGSVIDDGINRQQEIADLRTRCAYVLMHDVGVARARHPSTRKSRNVRIASPVSMIWKNESGVPVCIAWPLPRLQTFAEYTALLGRLNAEIEKMTTETSDELRSVPQQRLEELVRTWIILGQSALARSPQLGVTRYSSWSEIIQWLKTEAKLDAPSDEQLVWLMQAAMLTMPEACAIDLATKPRQIDGLPAEQRLQIQALESLAAKNIRELRGRRSRQLDSLWRDEFRDLWHHLNDRVDASSWLNLHLRSPMLRQSDDFAIAFHEFRGEIRKELQATELRLALDTETTQVRGLIRQGNSLLNSNAQAARSLLGQAMELAETLTGQYPHDEKLTRLLIDAAADLSSAQLYLLSPHESASTLLRAIETVSELLEKAPDDDSLKRRRIRLMIERANALIIAKNLPDALATANGAFADCETVLERDRDNLEWLRLRANCRMWTAVTLREAGRLDEAESELNQAIETLSKMDRKAARGDSISLDFVRAERYLATILWQTGRLNRALEMAQSVYSYASVQSSQHPDVNEMQQLHLHASALLGRIQLDCGDIDKATVLLRESLEIAERRASRDATALIRMQALARARLQLARALRLAQHSHDSLELLRLAHPVLSRIDLFNRPARHAAYDLGSVCLELAKTYLLLGNRAEAKHFADRAEESLTQADTKDLNTVPILLKRAELAAVRLKLMRPGKPADKLLMVARGYLRQAKERGAYFDPEITNLETEFAAKSQRNKRRR